MTKAAHDAYQKASELDNTVNYILVVNLKTSSGTYIPGMICIDDIQCVPVLVSFLEVVEVQIEEVSPPEFVVFTKQDRSMTG
jgi:hypothetical protein